MTMRKSCAFAGMLWLLVATAAANKTTTEQQPKKLVGITLSEGTLTASYPSSSTPQTVGSNVVYSTDLLEGEAKVGSVIWTGTYVYVAGDVARVSYLVNMNLTGGRYKGTLVGSGMGGGVKASPPVPLVVLGGTGDFEGATGTVTWGSPPARASNGGAYYTLKLFLPANSQTSTKPSSGQPSKVQTEAGIAG